MPSVSKNIAKKSLRILSEYPYRILLWNNRKDIFSDKVNFIKNSQENISMEYVQNITAETDSNGKKLYTNEEMRKAELYSRLSEDENYQENEIRMKKLNFLVKKISNYTMYLNDSMVNCRAYMPYIVELRRSENEFKKNAEILKS